MFLIFFYLQSIGGSKPIVFSFLSLEMVSLMEHFPFIPVLVTDVKVWITPVGTETALQTFQNWKPSTFYLKMVVDPS